MARTPTVLISFKDIRINEKIREAVETRCHALAEEFPETTRFELILSADGTSHTAHGHVTGRNTEVASHAEAPELSGAARRPIVELAPGQPVFFIDEGEGVGDSHRQPGKECVEALRLLSPIARISRAISGRSDDPHAGSLPRSGREPQRCRHRPRSWAVASLRPRALVCPKSHWSEQFLSFSG